ncbi:MAG: tripartite tricarboxylate transporter substrate binding protein [Alphaproteobacteria bacterium]|nr:tripartite tricarboxylate transporter substrate binding protein [Alphaproteobacteria bacterium]
MTRTAMLSRRALLAATAGTSLAAAFPAGARAQAAYPNRPVRVVVPFAPGGATDILGRLIAGHLQEALGQPFVVENRSGGGGNIGSDLVAKAAPDGYTLLIGAAGNIGINPGLFPNMPYDPVRDLAPISLMASTPNILVVHPSVPANNVAELIALARSRPNQLNFASSGNGSTIHLSAELFKALAQVQMTHVPYRGSGPAVADLLAGTVQLMFDNLPSAIPHVQAGRLRALGVTSAKRAPALPNVPTIAEAGVAGYEATSWFGLFAPAGTPRPVIERLMQEVHAGVAKPALAERIRSLGAEIVTNTPDQLATMVRTEIAKWREVIRVSGAKLD